MARGLDHLVIAVHDLDAAGRLYEAMGFTVGARNRHPWGTENRIVQFPGVFLELITVGEGAAIPPHAEGVFSFGAFVRDSLARREGVCMLVLESHDAEADRSAFDAAGIGGFARFDFERQAARPDGSTVRVAFSLSFASARLMPEAGFFVCQQHEPQNFWNPAFQRHPNGAMGIASVTLLAENPSEHAEFLSHFTGVRELVSNSAGIGVPTPRGRIEVTSAAALAFHTGVDLAEAPPRIVGYTVGVPDLEAVALRLASAGIPAKRRDNDVVVDPRDAFGTLIVFRG